MVVDLQNKNAKMVVKVDINYCKIIPSIGKMVRLEKKIQCLISKFIINKSICF